MNMTFSAKIFTLFPDMFPGPLGESLAGKALKDGLWQMEAINIRDYAAGAHKTVDDTPFGGGAGMVMKPDVISAALEAHKPLGRLIYLSPRGKPLTQNMVQELSQDPHLSFLCGRYEGIDQRVIDAYDMDEISIGDYVLAGGELAVMVILEACVRLLPGVMGNDKTVTEESFTDGLLEYPHYTRPAAWTGPDGTVYHVPEVLTSGHHDNIKTWQREQSEALTRVRRPDLWAKKGKKS